MIELSKHHAPQGNISVVENNKDVPFNVKRIYYLYDVPGGESRGAHAHKQCHQFLVAASGAFEVLLEGKYRIVEHTDSTMVLKNMELEIPLRTWKRILLLQ